MVPERKEDFKFDVYEDNGKEGAKFFGVKLYIDEQIVSKAVLLQRKSRKKQLPKSLFRFSGKNI